MKKIQIRNSISPSPHKPVITLRPSTIDDREMIYHWLAQSDITSSMLGPPDFPDNAVPSFEEFLDDYKSYFFDGSNPKAGRSFIILLDGQAIGQINHDMIYFDGCTELDIWMASSDFTGKGFGTQALQLMCHHLSETFDCHEFFIAPSLRNLQAIKSYRKAGFMPCHFPPAWFQPDYIDTYLMTKIYRPLTYRDN